MAQMHPLAETGAVTGAGSAQVGNPAVERLARLDGLRGLAACLVAFPYHTRILFDPAQFTAGSICPALAWLQEWGWTFVDMFFVLSGYVFAHVYLGGKGLKSRADLADFTVARIARLYPLHLLMLAITALFMFGTANNGMVPLLANLVMLQAFLRPFVESFNSPSWSLSVEALCYVVFAVAATVGKRELIAVTVVMIAIAVCHFVLNGQPGGPYVADVVPRGFLGFFLGQLLWHQRLFLARVPSLVLVALLFTGVYLVGAPISPLLPLTVLAWPAALLLALRLRLFESAPMVWLGDRSYAIYLINLPIIWALGHYIGPLLGSGWLVLGVHLLVIALVLAASDLSLRLVENPARRAIRKAWHSRRRIAENPLTA